ncbi:MAG: polysaccharide deacetylase family protein [Oscillospiraceae bacterium]|nr:polysaccharide deacetylase family protein [Oscillospiraceae bacterium]
MHEDKIIALTFDDGPGITTTVQILDILQKYDVPASFFVVGNNISSQTEEVMRRAVSMGCEIQNHSRTHRDMTVMTAEEITEEIRFTSDRVREAVGKAPEFFRPPYIAVNDLMRQTVGLPFIQGVGAEDYLDEVSAQERCDRIIAQAGDGKVILLHDKEGNFRTVDAVEMIIPKLKAEGYRFVTISDLFKEKGITPKVGAMYTTVFEEW